MLTPARLSGASNTSRRTSRIPQASFTPCGRRGGCRSAPDCRRSAARHRPRVDLLERSHITMDVPLAAATPPDTRCLALAGSMITLAAAAAASPGLPSVEPLSATTTRRGSPLSERLEGRRSDVSIELASLRQGITAETSGVEISAGFSAVCCEPLYSPAERDASEPDEARSRRRRRSRRILKPRPASQSRSSAARCPG